MLVRYYSGGMDPEYGSVACSPNLEDVFLVVYQEQGDRQKEKSVFGRNTDHGGREGRI